MSAKGPQHTFSFFRSLAWEVIRAASSRFRRVNEARQRVAVWRLPKSAWTAKTAMAPYRDYHKALADGFQIFLPNIPQPQYHFTKYENGRDAWLHFDPLKPTSLLYKKTPDGGYELVGAMYTARVDATEAELNERIPLSIARWHQHVNFCKAPAGQKAGYFGPDAKFGLMGSITTREACEAAGGEFHPHIFGWMVHLYRYETYPREDLLNR